VRLGQGTSQHMLIAGKTGSGKSTFLHGLITNLALHYSPNELQFFLIDFKKGVEFKDYAQFHLPHARVIAIESDREFGVSALTRLDELMAERGELFRRHGAQDVNGFRSGNSGIPMPRILLVIDEFQEFFTEDDKYAQTAALLLDRLVRQGRAFGIHVILGSQTLGGAYSLARSTLGQVAVRVALQCSEADAHLILSEDNTAARLLSRPGEAIYNDANGLVEGNHPFQIAWLPDDKREQYLRELEQLAEARGLGVESPIVFEGNIPSDLAGNTTLRKLLAGEPVEGLRKTAPRVWLGDAVEIGDPTSVLLERQSSANVLLVGQDAEAVQGMMTAAAMAVSAQSETADPVIYLFDGSAADDPVREVWGQLEQTLGNRFRRVAPNQAVATLAELTAERERRDADRDVLPETCCVLVYNLSRFRDLRRSEDDFGFGGGFGSGAEAKAPPAKQFTQLLSSGPELGMHAIVWADSYNNVERWFSRQQLRDFELRILFPMNAADASNLIDSPLASRLGTGRAILYREDRGSVEKFRPYAVPAFEWLATAGAEPEESGSEEESELRLDEFTVT
ncbi:MAG TPA: FtsK/SpoIIIE domain-containing protein, partial [Caulifigura sp.]|nr:FtsK/SpoIIIE domain-containing protein [Caulifigura sp.]